MSYSPVKKDILCLWVFINTVNKDNGYKRKAHKYGEKEIFQISLRKTLSGRKHSKYEGFETEKCLVY